VGHRPMSNCQGIFVTAYGSSENHVPGLNIYFCGQPDVGLKQRRQTNRAGMLLDTSPGAVYNANRL
jgi:hypothetical protein